MFNLLFCTVLYVDVLSILKEGGNSDTCDDPCPTSKEKEKTFYTPNFSQFWSKTKEYKPVIDVDSASFQIKETVFTLFGEKSTKEISPSADALMKYIFPENFISLLVDSSKATVKIRLLGYN